LHNIGSIAGLGLFMVVGNFSTSSAFLRLA